LVNGYPSDTNLKQCFNYCSNDAVCLMNDENNPTCYCLPGWKGERCDIIREFIPTDSISSQQLNKRRINLRNVPCDFAPDNMCNGNGICQYNGTQLTCACTGLYTGAYCEKISSCAQYCFNGGICTIDSTSNAPSCNCTEGWGDIRCQNPLTTTIDPAATTTTSTTTLHPACSFVPPDYCNAGQCVVVNGKISCQCPSTHTGDKCQTPSGGTPPPPATVVTIPPPGSTVSSQTVQPPGSTVSSQTVQPPSPTVSSQTVQPPSPTVSGQPATPPGGITCAQKPCQNGRPCYNNGNSYFCYCGPQFQGINCESNAG